MLSEHFQELLAGVRQEQERLEAQREGLMDQVAAIDEELRVLRNISKAVDPPAPKAKSNGGANTQVAEHTLRKMLDWMEAHPDQSPFRTSQVATALGVSQATVTTGFRELRQRGDLVLAGQGEMNARLWRLAEDGDAPPPPPHNGVTYGITRAPSPPEGMRAQQREAEERKAQLVQWAMRYGKPFEILTALREMGKEGDTHAQQRMGSDLRDLADRGVLRRTGRNVFPEWKKHLPVTERGKAAAEYELAVTAPQATMNGSGHGEPALAT